MSASTSFDTICSVGFDEMSLQVQPFERTCRYHKRQDQKFDCGQLLPKGMCPHLYRAAYPHALALLYDATYPSSKGGKPVRKKIVKCPSGGASVQVEVSIEYTMPLIMRKLKQMAVKTCLTFGIPAEYPDRNIKIKVLGIEGSCPLGHKADEIYLFNIKNREELCPASFYGSYPMFFDRQEGGNPASIHCPDPFGVLYSVPGITGSPGAFQNFNIKVSNSNKVKADNCSPIGSHPIEKLLPKNLCPLVFYQIYPYFVTFVHGGRFEWLQKGESVKVHCPEPNGVMMGIESIRYESPGDGAIRVTVMEGGGDCGRGLKAGDVFEFDSRNQDFCFEALATLIPFKNVGGSIACPSIESSLEFRTESTFKKAETSSA